MEQGDISISENTILALQSKALNDIADLVQPWLNMEELVKPMPIVIKNETAGSSHMRISIAQGRVVIELLVRVAQPESDVLVVGRGDEREIDLAMR